MRDEINRLREKMKEHGIDVYLVVSDDFHASEYVCDYFKCREYLSGFTGSAGSILITKDRAGLWTDGRYFIQAEEQLKDTGIELMKAGLENVPTISDFLYDSLNDGDCIGYDGRTMKVSFADALKEKLKEKNITFIEEVDLVGDIWEDRPLFPSAEVWTLSPKYAGMSRADKLIELRSTLDDEGADAILIASLDDIAWLYNIRGNDLKYSPVALAYSVITKDRATIYRDLETFDKDVLAELKKDGVEILPYFQIYDDVKEFSFKTVWIDESKINVVLKNNIPENVELITKTNPTTIAKAIKNNTEIENERYAHVLDGTAVTKLIYWLKQKQESDEIWDITELDVCEKLEELRKQEEGYLEPSFASIVATASHGAIVHYEPTKDTNAYLKNNNFVLMDVGAQYLDGTTDVTRTVAIGTLTREQKVHYTAVLKGHLNLANAKFKYGCTGANLDSLARRPLWEKGLDYLHGTGHGVGYLLNVHEGPQGIRLKEVNGSVGPVLEAGMITSNEPGVYLEGKYGIRIENLILCQNDKKTEFGQFMKFETLTLVPYEREAVIPEMLTEQELKWLNSYHELVYEKLSGYLSESEKKWLREQTKPIE